MRAFVWGYIARVQTWTTSLEFVITQKREYLATWMFAPVFTEAIKHTVIPNVYSTVSTSDRRIETYESS